MANLFWDASALAKRYLAEAGSATVLALFAGGHGHRMISTHWAYAETYSVLQRRLNGGQISIPTFRAATASLATEFFVNGDIGVLSIPDWSVVQAVTLIHRHNLNATDAVLPTFQVDRVRASASGGPAWVLLASDQRLLRTASVEGVHVLNPEVTTPAAAIAFLASL